MQYQQQLQKVLLPDLWFHGPDISIRNSVRSAYIHKAGYLEGRIAMMQWWADYLDANKGGYVSPYQNAGHLKVAS